MLTGETYAFSNGLDYAMSIKMLFKALEIVILLYIFIDS